MHFSLFRMTPQSDGAEPKKEGVALDGKVFGGWRLNAGSKEYSGTATRLRDNYTVQLPTGSANFQN